MNILIVGSGGREHAIGWKLSQSPACDRLFYAPGNAGTAQIGTNLSVAVEDFDGIKNVILQHNITMVVVGPEVPLVLGLTDYLKADSLTSHCLVIGPGKAGAQLEGSKDFSKAFMQKYGIPTAAARTFQAATLAEGKAFLASLKPPYVLKADGLAAGKGVIITDKLTEAQATLEDMLLNKTFGEASAKVLVEEYMHGIELSVFVLTDGQQYKILPEAKDYKRIGDGDVGPNTGGMGAVSPVPFAHPEFLQKVEKEVVLPTLHGLQQEGIPYVGFIFIGLMNVDGQPKVIEYNVRMGDPETEVVIPRIKTDLVKLLQCAATGTLDSIELEVDARTATTVMLVAEGYPGNYAKGQSISGFDLTGDTLIFHAGTSIKDGRTVTNGGRVIACTGMGKTKSEALSESYRAAKVIEWNGKRYRNDIGLDV